MLKRIVFLAGSMGLLLSPQSLIVCGNAAGVSVPVFVISLCVATALFLVNAVTYERVFIGGTSAAGEAPLLRDSFGKSVATALLLCSRAVVAVSLSTLLLARAGYVFNEIFVHWFPNLGFSFALLAAVLAVNLISARVTGAIQGLAAVIILAGLGTMITIGLAGWGNRPPVAQGGFVAGEEVLKAIALPFTIFIGFELFGFMFSREELSGAWRKTAWGALMAVAVSLGLWGLVSSMYVSSDALSVSTVPYSLAARAIWGESGRMTVGLVVLAGCWLSVSVLLRSTAGMMARLAEKSMLPALFQRSIRTPWMPLSFLATAVGLLMAFGFAGEEITEVFSRGGICFWLITYAGVNLALFRSLGKLQSGSNGFLFFLLSLLFSAIAVIMIATDPRPADVVRFMALAAASCIFLTWIWWVVSGRKAHSSIHS